MNDSFKEKTDRALASLRLSAQERRQLIAFAMEEHKMKKKMPAVFIIAVALILILGSVTIADGMNVFAMFTNYDKRLEKLIYSSVIEDPVPVKVETDYIGTSYVTLTNAHFGYIATRKSFELGGYETRISGDTKMAPETGYDIADTAVRLIEQMK